MSNNIKYTFGIEGILTHLLTLINYSLSFIFILYWDITSLVDILGLVRLAEEVHVL